MPRRVQIIGGKLKSGVDFRALLLGALEDFDVTLIRVCDCDLIYLAKRRAQTGCSKRCSNRVRQKAFRESNPGYHRRHAHARVIRMLAAPCGARSQ